VRLFETIDAKLGTIAGLVNNAGILERQLRVEPKAPPHAKR